MDKHTVIVIIASIVIAAPFVFSAWNIYAVEQIQLVGYEQEQFEYFGIVNDGKISVCNPLPLNVNFNKLDITMVLDQREKGTFSVQDITLSPSSITNLEGVFSSEGFQEAQYLALHFDGMFGSDQPIRIDPNRFSITTEIHTPILGIIPYSVTKQHSGFDFWNMMNERNSQISC